MTLIHGQIKLLEDENTHDLCQIILNNLSMIKREREDRKNKSKIVVEDVLIVEHKIFFKEEYRAIYDKKNKNIRAKYAEQMKKAFLDCDGEINQMQIHIAELRTFVKELSLSYIKPKQTCKHA